MKRYKCVLSYDGTCFLGWQDNKQQQSIEEHFKSALAKIFPSFHSLEAASRTDRGVHALGQVVCFTAPNPRYPLNNLLFRLNRLLAPLLYIESIEEVSSTFHPSLDCQAKTYLYQIYNQSFLPPFKKHYYWHVAKKLDVTTMQAAAQMLLQQRDFSSLINRSKDFSCSQCIIDSIKVIQKDDPELFIEVTGKSFLYKMVRNIVGFLVEIGKNPCLLNKVEQILEKEDRREAPICAPAHALFLKEVIYKQEKDREHT